MRPLALLTLCFSLVLASTAEARLFWQTYGSTIPAGNGCGTGCTWNWNQDYFIPRHGSTGRYGLYSPCKTSRTTSPASIGDHPRYPGYCNIYGPSHSRRRNHVYQSYCGCTPMEATCVPWRNGCGPTNAPSYQAHSEPILPFTPADYLPNVEPPGLLVLGSISVEGDGILANLDATSKDDPAAERNFLSPQAITPTQALQALEAWQSGGSSQALPFPTP